MSTVTLKMDKPSVAKLAWNRNWPLLTCNFMFAFLSNSLFDVVCWFTSCNLHLHDCSPLFPPGCCWAQSAHPSSYLFEGGLPAPASISSFVQMRCRHLAELPELVQRETAPCRGQIHASVWDGILLQSARLFPLSSASLYKTLSAKWLNKRTQSCMSGITDKLPESTSRLQFCIVLPESSGGTVMSSVCLLGWLEGDLR